MAAKAKPVQRCARHTLGTWSCVVLPCLQVCVPMCVFFCLARACDMVFVGVQRISSRAEARGSMRSDDDSMEKSLFPSRRAE
jgi:hypothetical protein